NLAAGDGHPAEIMDLSFALQLLALDYLRRQEQPLPREVLPLPRELDRQVASLKLHSLGVKIDRLTPQQERYLNNT
ncbi:MAG TPA: adenosylhomocysteinase, partial [Bacillota bacterium]|nr:adenosylhomocysteinase [Bacillota bacterium]